MKESDLFDPVRNYLSANGYRVRAEVKNCDIVASKDNRIIIIELKLTPNLELIFQATERQRITPSVYTALPRAVIKSTKRWKKFKYILKRLGVGLILIDLDDPNDQIEIILHPIKFQKKKNTRLKSSIIRELDNRSQNLNIGGINRTKIITAYKENAIQIAVYLNKLGASSPKKLRSYQTGKKTLSILSNNYYGWFQRISRGVYDVTSVGKKEIQNFPGLVKKYQNYLEKIGD
ncbi:MAG: hypothetical protein K9N07_00175 [Candidatus Cloacimonetes bacterium]|nr:hypothetical protein [Candidatus Cloacimonadota bacterium]